MNDPKSEIIERLKHNEDPYRVFCDMDKEERSAIRWAKKRGILQYLMSHNGVIKWSTSGSQYFLHPTLCFRIDPDFQLEPEYEDCPIQLTRFGDLVYDNGNQKLISRATVDPQFLCYVADGQSIGRCPGNVPSPYRDRMKCAVRFLK